MTAAQASLTSARPRFWRYGLLALAVLLLGVLIQAPAGLLKRFWPTGSPVQAVAWGGTLWNGQVMLRQGERNAQLLWNWQPLALFKGTLGAHLEVQGPAAMQANAAYGAAGWRVSQLNGVLPGDLVQQALPAGWSLPGDLRAESVTVARAGVAGGDWKQADGSLHWQGGAMHYSLEGQAQEANLPPMALRLSLAGNALLLDLQEENGAALGSVQLGADNVAETRLRQRLLEYTPGYHGQGAPDQVVVTVKQAI